MMFIQTERFVHLLSLNVQFLIQQSPQVFRNKIYYSIGLVMACLVILILLWLPDLLKGKRD